MFGEWVKIASVIPDYADKISELSCPNCGNHTIDYIYIGDEETKVGFELVWCNSCKKGIHISRVIISPGVKMLTFNEATKRIKEIVPEFTRVTPDE